MRNALLAIHIVAKRLAYPNTLRMNYAPYYEQQNIPKTLPQRPSFSSTTLTKYTSY
jgi:hypothetical protein